MSDPEGVPGSRGEPSRSRGVGWSVASPDRIVRREAIDCSLREIQDKRGGDAG